MSSPLEGAKEIELIDQNQKEVESTKSIIEDLKDWIQQMKALILDTHGPVVRISIIAMEKLEIIGKGRQKVERKEN